MTNSEDQSTPPIDGAPLRLTVQPPCELLAINRDRSTFCSLGVAHARQANPLHVRLPPRCAPKPPFLTTRLCRSEAPNPTRSPESRTAPIGRKNGQAGSAQTLPFPSNLATPESGRSGGCKRGPFCNRNCGLISLSNPPVGTTDYDPEQRCRFEFASGTALSNHRMIGPHCAEPTDSAKEQ